MSSDWNRDNDRDRPVDRSGGMGRGGEASWGQRQGFGPSGMGMGSGSFGDQSVGRGGMGGGYGDQGMGGYGGWQGGFEGRGSEGQGYGGQGYGGGSGGRSGQGMSGQGYRGQDYGGGWRGEGQDWGGGFRGQDLDQPGFRGSGAGSMDMGGGFSQGPYGGQGYSNQGYSNQGLGSQSFGRQAGGWGPSFGGQGFEQPGMGQMAGPHAGRGPKGYQRNDQRIEEDINEALTRHGHLDASQMQVTVKHGEVTLSGTVDSRQAKRLAEDIAESCSGVKDVHNQLKVDHAGNGQIGQTGQVGQSQTAKAGSSRG
jgi:BON domain-containing protein